MSLDHTVYLIDNNNEFRKSLSDLFKSVKLKVIEFESGQTFLEYPQNQGPSCVVLELMLSEIDGLEVLKTLRSRMDLIPVIILTACGDIPTAVRCLQQGAIGFFQKPINHLELLKWVHKGLAQESHYYKSFGNPREMATRINSLTPRERQVADGLVIGKPNKTIAWELDTSIRTIEAHRANLMKKLRIKSVAGLVRFMLLSGSTFAEPSFDMAS